MKVKYLSVLTKTLTLLTVFAGELLSQFLGKVCLCNHGNEDVAMAINTSCLRVCRGDFHRHASTVGHVAVTTGQPAVM